MTKRLTRCSPEATRKHTPRFAEKQDEAGLIDLIVAIDLFPPDELEELRKILETSLSEPPQGEFWLVDDDPIASFSGVAYCVPERMTQGTWNLLLIGVHAERRRQGRGTRLLKRVEAILRERGGRILIVETSSTDGFEDTRRFYSETGYTEEARIRDFYKSGDDKVVFWMSPGQQ